MTKLVCRFFVALLPLAASLGACADEGSGAGAGPATGSDEQEATSSSNCLDVDVPYVCYGAAVAPRLPKAVPANAPAAILNVTTPSGNTWNLATGQPPPGVTNKPGFKAFAKVTAAFRTTNTPAQVLAFAGASPATAPVEQPGAPAAQVYQCRAGSGWTFLRPEAGLEPILSSPLPPDIQSIGVTFDHFRFPGGLAYPRFFDNQPQSDVTPPAGPAWRVNVPGATNQQSLFIASQPAEVSVPKAGTIPELRLRRATNLPLRSAEHFYAGFFNGQYMLRLNTQGGAAPTKACNASNDGAIERVPYSTDYYAVDLLEYDSQQSG
ncbi:MAG TPA: DUF3455 domain-containing protein [Polyangiaceae bacterium]|nr:DUF3455 domain-containing protein [Polyangiaceae bacterium]